MIAAVALHLWQSTLILILAWALARACRHNAAAIRYSIWFAASLKFLVPFALLQQLGDAIGRCLPGPFPVDPAFVQTGRTLFVPSVSPLIDDLPLIQILLGMLWAGGAMVVLLRWLQEWRALHLRLARGRPGSIALPVPVCITCDDVPPGVFGIFRPVVILPRAILRKLNMLQMRAVLAHEMCHIERRDNLTAALHKCVEVIFWFHPLVWWLGANLLREREAACDESVVEDGHDRGDYAEALLRVCRLGMPKRVGALAASTGGDLRGRILAIMTRERARAIGSGRYALVLASALAVCWTPFAVGVIAGAHHEASDSGPIAFDTLTLRPAPRSWWPSAEFDSAGQRLVLRNISVRALILRAYPSSFVQSESEFIDRTYDIDAQWHGERDTSKRNVYRELVRRILRTNSNLELYVQNHREI